jgi:universal stress protein A
MDSVGSAPWSSGDHGMTNLIMKQNPVQPRHPATPRRVLVPVDFSRPSLAALRHALALAADTGARVVLLHVLEPFHPGLHLDTTAIQTAARQAANKRLEALLIASRKTWPAVSRELRAGHPVTTIIALAKRTQADLIVLGTHGRTGLRRALIGSVAERVVREAPCPVLVVR